MIHLISLVVSYGALLFLLMPPTAEGIVLTGVFLILGIVLMIHKKIHLVAFWKNRQYLLIATAILAVAYFGTDFYYKWLPSSKMNLIATIFHMSTEMTIIVVSSLLSIIATYFVYVGLQMIVKILSETNSQNYFKNSLLCCLVCAVVTVLLAQAMIGVAALSMGYIKFLFGVLIVSVIILFLYSLLGRIIPSVFVGTAIFMVISTINVYVYNFRGRLFEPVDVFSAGTAINVAENYSLFPIPFNVLASWAIFIAMLIAVYCLQRKNKFSLVVRKRFVLLAICAISSVAILFYIPTLKTYHWQKEGAQINGYVLDFVSKFKEISQSEPDGYSTESIAKLADEYKTESDAQEKDPSKYPHIIVIMDEAFSDLSVASEFSTNTEVMPFISSLKENTISGYALASVYGGNTANSEYEFLTGNSMAWMSPNAVPYQQYIKSSTYSMVSHLKSLNNYKCISMHPFESSGWNRPLAYRYLGFDECYFVEDFPQKNYVREYVSDQEMFDFLIKTYEEQKRDPLFLYGVTMQNHGGYTYAGENYTKSISLNNHGDKFPDVEQYLSLIRETDKAVERLITYFKNVDEDVVVVFFGDHQPKIDESFYEINGGKKVDTLDEKQKRYKVPFFIWTNYDIAEKHIDCTSLNYLSSYVYDAAGITLSPYNKFLKEMECEIPAINANGFYSSNKGCYLSFDNANEEEQSWLRLYKALQYNNVFDKKNRNKTFFPVLENN